MKSKPLEWTAEAWCDIDTPLGAMTALATARGLAALWFDARERFASSLAGVPEDTRHPHLAAARRWLQAYWRGSDTPSEPVALDLHGSAFQRAVWQQLVRIPFGQTRTYGELAAQIGAGAAARAAGAACGANPVGVIVPCHRVIGASGSLTGFAAGLPRKLSLLQHEGLLRT